MVDKKEYTIVVPEIQYNEKFINDFKKIKPGIKNRISINCKYPGYFGIILDSTPLLNVLVNLICSWIDDVIILTIEINESSCLMVNSENTYINFIPIQIGFGLLAGRFYNMHFCNNILMFNKEISKLFKNVYTYNIYLYNIGRTCNVKKINKNTCVLGYRLIDNISANIVDNNILLTVCDFVYTFKCFVDQTKN